METSETFIEIRGGREVLVDGFTRLTGYREDEIRVMTNKREIVISGTGLRMDMMNEGKIAVSGTVRSVTLNDLSGGKE